MNKNIPLILDSSVYKQMPKLNSQLFEELIKHTRVGLYKIYISEIVEKEFISWAKSEAQDSFDKIVRATRSLDKYYQPPNILGIDLEINLTAMVAEKQINQILESIVKTWNEFKKAVGAVIIPIAENHGKLVMDAYFDGKAPFSQIKNRNDIPDAFIYFATRDIVQKYSKVVFVTSDKRLLSSIQSEEIQCFESIAHLFSSGPVRLNSEFFESLGNQGDCT